MKDSDNQAASRRRECWASLYLPSKVGIKDSGNEAEKGYPFLMGQ